MAEAVPFEEILGVLELHGWKLQRIDPPYRVFMKKGELPILVPVYDKKVNTLYVAKIEKILKGQTEND